MIVGEDLQQFIADQCFGQDVIDFGCGVGMLAPIFSKLRYRGVDIDPSAIKIAIMGSPGYRFEIIDETSPIEGGHVLLAHDVMRWVSDVPSVIERFRQRRVIVLEPLGERDLVFYEAAFRHGGYRLHRVQFKEINHPEGAGRAFLEFHRERKDHAAQP